MNHNLPPKFLAVLLDDILLLKMNEKI